MRKRLPVARTNVYFPKDIEIAILSPGSLLSIDESNERERGRETEGDRERQRENAFARS